MTKEPDTIHEYLDCTGKRRRFRLEEQPPGFLEAFEIRDDDEPGLRFILALPPAGTPPYGDLHDRIAERLSQRHLVRDEHGKLDNLHRVIRAQIHGAAPEESGPMLVIDDLRISWDELGQVLQSYEGWGLRIQICACGSE
jgi:hypothetical protein